MSVKHISDLQVVQAYIHAKISGVWPEDTLAQVTGQPLKVCYRAMERAYRRGLIEYGVSLRSGWLTDKGKELTEGDK